MFAMFGGVVCKVFFVYLFWVLVLCVIDFVDFADINLICDVVLVLCD